MPDDLPETLRISEWMQQLEVIRDYDDSRITQELRDLIDAAIESLGPVCPSLLRTGLYEQEAGQPNHCTSLVAPE